MKIAVLPGDGIGTEIVAEAVKVLNVLDLKLEIDACERCRVSAFQQAGSCGLRPRAGETGERLATHQLFSLSQEATRSAYRKNSRSA